MKALRKILDNIKPHVSKGGRFEMLHSTYDAFETLLFVPDRTNKNGVHVRDAIDLKRTMMMVVFAMIPALVFGIWNTGYQHHLALGESASFFDNILHGVLRVVPILVVSYATALGLEFGFAQMRKHEVNEGVLVSGMLIPLIIPIDTPLWMVAIATAFAIIIGKEVFGGTGMNIWNPALLARAFLFFAYPAQMSGDIVWISGLGSMENLPDGFSGATALAAAVEGNISNFSFMDSFLGFIPGSIGETSTLAILLGAMFLIITGVGSWKVMLSVFVGGYLMALVFNLMGLNPLMQVEAHHHLVLGGFAFGAVFMATDPVSATRTEQGKWIYGFLIGVFAIMIRVFNPAYPEGMMLAILLMNTFAPLIDHFVVQANIKRRLNRAVVKA
ncbi:NADH:ubiquinone reductase (Na(+)-transporting) subunit B [Alkalitalea saponilacus]|uniref:Na(+)-translocating NADH-quinone reductase subunit B n=1 Tax=Alkalitalea saponilacus TaxID=889453 RepID=A0A1T5BPL7_9BACT|nr:NADH:ubiquinone reductase (Na(+)-transporting) subunit B [Alkalitalea saponilacus]ASB49636.1 NADH:ubiquinone reductase (Na(+)-transporting) subunit B [Alkalitalea saponilacus]SKB49049.1 Na+-transporting NADH:ubiquinone oxidoreductase subunit B [Alkalitalea saponilacus]